jgi:hypothetical protein
MSKPLPEDLLLEEYKNAYEHIRYVETKRDRYVPAIVTASGVVLLLMAKLLSDNEFIICKTSYGFFIVAIVLSISLGLLSVFSCMAYKRFSNVMRHYENVIAVARKKIFGDKEQELIDVNGQKKTLITWIDTRKNQELEKRSITYNIFRTF